MPRPQLEPPCPGWKRDLPAPNDTPELLEAFGEPPNHVDEVYLEFPRSSFRGRGLVLLATAWAVGTAVFGIIALLSIGEPVDIMLSLLIAALAAFACAHAYRVDISAPIDEPIRFNRQRRKVYVYRFHYCRWRPFNSSLWYVKPEVYDWDALRAEFYQIYVPTVTYNSGVNIAIVKPGSNKVIDRLYFGDGMKSANYWNMAVAFMQSGPDALPRFDSCPPDLENEDTRLKPLLRFALKVKWPEAIDIESRTAP